MRQYVVGNEPNQGAFWRPQFARASQRSARAFGPFLAAGYDALDAVDPDLTVVGVGLSPRGNDRPLARSNVSTSPVRFLAMLGSWYRASGREQPLMDGFSFHPYPNVATDPLGRGYPWPNAGFVNLERIKQALWDAFAGTGQPTTVDGLRLHLDEVGWQVDTSGLEGYEGSENVAVTSEGAQAAIYGELVRRASCDPDVAQVNIFGFRDDSLRTGFQAGLHRVDGTPRPAAIAVGEAIASSSCLLGTTSWRPRRTVVGLKRPRVAVVPGSVAVHLAAAEGASAQACLLRGAHTLSSARRLLAARTVPSGVCATGTVRPNRRTTLKLPRATGPCHACGAPRRRGECRASRDGRPRAASPSSLTPNRCSVMMRTDVRFIAISYGWFSSPLSRRSSGRSSRGRQAPVGLSASTVSRPATHSGQSPWRHFRAILVKASGS